jgi:hypothetical protein
LIAIALAAGCSHYAQHVELAREHFYSGRLEMAAAAFDEAIPKSQGSGDVINLEKSLVLLADGRPAEAESLLREVRDRFDHLELSSPTEKAVSMFTDDTRIAYAGEDYEKVLIRAMLALTNLMHDGGDAEAYSLQVRRRRSRARRIPRPPTSRSPSGRTSAAFSAKRRTRITTTRPARSRRS